jgi:Ser/Thr protein kinase RdoA (MazF antagonist)
LYYHLPVIDEILARYAARPTKIVRAPSGLIQETWLVDTEGGRRLVVQRMNPLFGESVLEDIETITTFLEQQGMTTPRLIRTQEGGLGVTDTEGKLWRVLGYLEGHTVDRVTSPAMAREAGQLVARFHRTLAPFDHTFKFSRSGVHDTAAHLGRLSRARELPAGDERIRPLADAILAQAQELTPLGGAPRRLVHGDLKISNILFRHDKAIALIDLDTMGYLPMAYELGDAWRSWCNPLGEDVEQTRFDRAVFKAAVEGYAAGAEGFLEPDEVASLVTGVWTVCVELAARFCVDAFEDRYFGWDPTRFPSRREHNRVRAAGQLALARQVGDARAEAEAIVQRAFGPTMSSGFTH